jgi:hypothetical protein
MDPAADLEAALQFVIRRIEEESVQSGEPLSDEQRALLHNLPKESSLPDTSVDPESPPVLFVPRDIAYERLCEMAKAALHKDLQQTESSPNWEFAFAVSKLNRHPMCWLLQWAGMKQRRPWWDRPLLVGLAGLLTFATLALIMFAETVRATGLRMSLAVAGGLMMILAYFAVLHLEERQLKQTVERLRRG